MHGLAGKPSITPLFLHCQRPFPLPQRLVHLPSWQAHRFRPLRKAATTTGLQRLFISYGRPRDDSERRPAPSRVPGASTTENCLRSRIARVVSHRNGEAHDRCREYCWQTTTDEHVWYVGTWSWSQSAVSSAAPASEVGTTISVFPALKAKRENFPLRADHNLHYLDAIVPERLSEYVNVEETSSVMLWHGRLGHIDAQIFQKLTQEKCTGMGVKDLSLIHI